MLSTDVSRTKRSPSSLQIGCHWDKGISRRQASSCKSGGPLVPRSLGGFGGFGGFGRIFGFARGRFYSNHGTRGGPCLKNLDPGRVCARFAALNRKKPASFHRKGPRVFRGVTRASPRNRLRFSSWTFHLPCVIWIRDAGSWMMNFEFLPRELRTLEVENSAPT